jgi:alkaline phosphatase D
MRSDYHQYLKILGGFLSVSIEDNTEPKITFNHHSPKGEVRYSKSFLSKQ